MKKINFVIRKIERINVSAFARTSALGLVALFCLTFIGCSKDAEINSFLTEWETATNEIVQKIEADPSSAGVDGAPKNLGRKKKPV